MPHHVANTNLPSGLRPPTWGFFLSDNWRVKLGLKRQQILAALDQPIITITDCGNGQWIELGPQPDLYPVEKGIPRLPAKLAQLLRPVLHQRLELPDIDIDQSHERRLTAGWASRFGNAQDAEQSDLTQRGSDGFCPRTGWWRSLQGEGARIHIRAGDILPSNIPGSARRIYHWQWCEDQRGLPIPDPEPARGAFSDEPAPRAGYWQALDAPTVSCRTEIGNALPRHQNASVLWCWVGMERDPYAKPSGDICRHPGLWFCEDHPTEARHFDAGQPLPQLEGQDVYWLLHELADSYLTHLSSAATELDIEALAERATASLLGMESAVRSLPDQAIRALENIQIDSAPEQK
ncbi:hypothetical protein IR009_23380 [Pseudomonas putida]|uniref:hypothetical protein n=1 Tax=Pseudomonas putida TaxID=303 RepID=UPI0018AA7707|nr:hypothetical protein [Pseudomonas putida]MBF8768132.1 hypothetical protein [Pseudomonas putida]